MYGPERRAYSVAPRRVRTYTGGQTSRRRLCVIATRNRAPRFRGDALNRNRPRSRGNVLGFFLGGGIFYRLDRASDRKRRVVLFYYVRVAHKKTLPPPPPKNNAYRLLAAACNYYSARPSYTYLLYSGRVRINTRAAALK